MAGKAIADIPESYLEYRADFTAPMFEVWTIPNPLVSALFSTLRKWHVGLGDISWNKDPSTYKDFQVTFNVPKMNALIRLNMDAATFIAMNPAWSEESGLIELFETAMNTIRKATNGDLASQEIALAMHVKPGEKRFKDLMSGLVNSDILGSAEMYGISVYKSDSSLVIDKSVKYPESVFVRVQRQFASPTSFGEIAKVLYQDEMKALGFLGLEELLEG